MRSQCYSIRHAYRHLFVGPFVKRFTIMLSDNCLSTLSVCLSVCDVGVLWPNRWMDQDETWHGGIGLGPGHIVLYGALQLLPSHRKKHSSPLFSVSVYCGQTVAHLSYCWTLVPKSTARKECVSPGLCVFEFLRACTVTVSTCHLQHLFIPLYVSLLSRFVQAVLRRSMTVTVRNQLNSIYDVIPQQALRARVIGSHGLSLFACHHST